MSQPDKDFEVALKLLREARKSCCGKKVSAKIKEAEQLLKKLVDSSDR